MFGRGHEDDARGERDVFNERPTHEERTVVIEKKQEKKALPTAATIHTNMGDIRLELYPNIAPKTVENFVTHAKNGYYNNVIFHRIIKKFVSTIVAAT
jgi:peptidylprolyl isomerase domain and WD repeat-containing protein 1